MELMPLVESTDSFDNREKNLNQEQSCASRQGLQPKTLATDFMQAVFKFNKISLLATNCYLQTCYNLLKQLALSLSTTRFENQLATKSTCS